MLAINASPRKSGSVARLVGAAADGAGATGMLVERVDLYDCSIAPCRACMKCRPDGECVLPEDDGHRLGRRIREAGALIIGTPTHWANMSTQLKALLDRNVPIFMGEGKNKLPVPRMKGKPVVLVTACTTPWPLNLLLGESRGALRAVRHILKYGGCRIVGTVVFPGSKEREVPEKLLACAKRLGGKIG